MMKTLISRISFTAVVMLILLLPVASPRAATPEAPNGKALAGKLLTYLGLDPAKRTQLESGAVVDNGLSGQEKLPRGNRGGWGHGARQGARRQHSRGRVSRCRNLPADSCGSALPGPEGGSVELAAFSTMPVPDVGRLQEIVKDPARNLNLDTAEAAKLKSLSPTASDLESRVRSTLAEILAARLDAYARQGLPGVKPYVRANGEVVDPAVELRAAIRGLAFLADAFPGFVDALGAPASGASSQLARQYYWMERKVDADNVLALSAELRRRDARAAIGADVHFYASREYNSMLTVIGVIPYESSGWCSSSTKPLPTRCWASALPCDD